jgi:hypothetical protein
MSADLPTPGRRPAAVLLGVALALFAGACPALADPVKAHPPAASDGQKVEGEVIDIMGLRERPRGDTRLPWAAPEGFTRTPEATPGRTLRDEVLQPVDREELRRLLEVERSVNW